jgi:hypothetical protein
MTWAQRLKRIFGIDIETCAACGGAVRIIACIEDPDVIEKILTHLDKCAGKPVAAANAGAVTPLRGDQRAEQAEQSPRGTRQTGLTPKLMPRPHRGRGMGA